MAIKQQKSVKKLEPLCHKRKFTATYSQFSFIVSSLKRKAQKLWLASDSRLNLMVSNSYLACAETAKALYLIFLSIAMEISLASSIAGKRSISSAWHCNSSVNTGRDLKARFIGCQVALGSSLTWSHVLSGLF